MRPAREADVAAIEEIVRVAFRPYVPRIGVEPGPMRADYAAIVGEGRCWVAEHEGRVVGMVQLAVEGSHLEVETVAVADEVRGLGVGSRLLAFAEDRARSLGLAEVRLSTNEAMTENIAYYPRRGYREVGRGVQRGYRRVFFAKAVGR